MRSPGRRLPDERLDDVGCAHAGEWALEDGRVVHARVAIDLRDLGPLVARAARSSRGSIRVGGGAFVVVIVDHPAETPTRRTRRPKAAP